MTEFSPLSATIGGLLIGASSVMMLVLNGRIAGISGVVGGLFRPATSDRAWRLWFIIGLLGGGLALAWAHPDAFGPGSSSSLPMLAVAGLLVGVGTRLGGGCTSGHGVCGISRLSKRSMLATVLFMTSAAATVFVSHHLIGA
ncbi:MAG: YeeE/YedE family protein [Deltaproteobacteria bacterium]|nr:YeeE/YedE family protein [Deltaproteobacteria bacterium]